MFRKYALSALTVFCFVAAASSAHAVGLAPDGNWVQTEETMVDDEFFTGSGGAASLATAGTWDFVSAGVSTLDITDWAVITDYYEIYDNDVLISTTPELPDWDAYTADPLDLAYFELDANDAWNRPEFSQVRLFLGAGAHSIKIRDLHIPIQVTGQPFTTGTVALRLQEGAVPEPGTLLLLGGGLAAAALRRRLKRNNG